jgi:peptidoglycan hydrolase CwlO-like protein
MTTRLALVLFILLFSATGVLAQEASAAQEVENLKSQLANLQNQETDLRNRLDQLDYDLRPENIENYFAGTGSTRPEELREQRRRQLQSEKDRINNQLNDIASRKSRLESAIVEAEAKAYQQSALGQAALQREPNEPRHFFTAARLAIGISLAVLLLAAIILLLVMKRRQNEL